MQRKYCFYVTVLQNTIVSSQTMIKGSDPRLIYMLFGNTCRHREELKLYIRGYES